jgi:cell fate regulator YaaT (PSP1 superfamily)
MTKVVGIRFREGGKVFEFETGEIPLSIGDPCIVETEDGLRFGEVATNPKGLETRYIQKNLGKVLRKANPEDFTIIEKNRELRKQAFSFCIRKIDELKLTMKLVEVEPYFDRSKVVFYFTAEGRVDFRQLVKELAHEVRMRIKMKQIGVRDEAKLLGGFGTCGRQLCCVSFLKDFEPVSIRMAKDQDLPLSPGKISGVCGRLMCCLVYESEIYREAKRGLPKINEKVRFGEVQGRVVRNNIFEEFFVMESEDGEQHQVPKADWRKRLRPGATATEEEAPPEGGKPAAATEKPPARPGQGRQGGRGDQSPRPPRGQGERGGRGGERPHRGERKPPAS